MADSNYILTEQDRKDVAMYEKLMKRCSEPHRKEPDDPVQRALTCFHCSFQIIDRYLEKAPRRPFFEELSDTETMEAFQEPVREISLISRKRVQGLIRELVEQFNRLAKHAGYDVEQDGLPEDLLRVMKSDIPMHLLPGGHIDDDFYPLFEEPVEYSEEMIQ